MDHSPRWPLRLLFGLGFAGILIPAFALNAVACSFSKPDKSQTLSVTMSSGVEAEVSVEFFKGWPEGQNAGSCAATATIALSQFPTVRVAARPAQLAAALREILDEWGVKECSIWILYENDTQDDVAGHELCVTGTFAYDKGDYWSSSSERTCWEPDSF